MKHELATTPPAVETLTPTASDLAALLEDRDAASAELETLTGRVDRLARAKDAIAPLEDELRAMGIREFAAALEWAERDDGSDAPPPTPFAEPRSIQARRSPSAGRRSRWRDRYVSIASRARQHYEFARSRLASLRPPRWLSSRRRKQIFPELTEAIAKLEAVKGRLSAARDFMLRATSRLRAKPWLRGLDFEGFDNRLNVAAAKRPFNADVGEWFSLAVRLARDAREH